MPAVMRGLHARDSERNRAVLKFGQMLETPSILRYGPSLYRLRRSGEDVTKRQVRPISRKGSTPTEPDLDDKVSIASGPVLGSKLKVRLANH